MARVDLPCRKQENVKVQAFNQRQTKKLQKVQKLATAIKISNTNKLRNFFLPS